MRSRARRRPPRRSACVAALVVCALSAPLRTADDGADDGAEHLSDLIPGRLLEREQAWGELGIDTAAFSSAAPSPLRIGERVFAKGLGHHAGGKLVFDLRGEYTSLRALAGVQWQGGGRGSVAFRILVDGVERFAAGPLGDSDPPREVSIDVRGAHRLALIAEDAGDGIACDMANWAEARLLGDERSPRFGQAEISLGGELAPPPSSACGGLRLVAGARGPQVAIAERAGRFAVAVPGSGGEARLVIPLRNVREPLRIAAEVSHLGGEAAEVSLEAAGSEPCRRTLNDGAARLEIEVNPAADAAPTSVACVTSAPAGETSARWERLSYILDETARPVPLSASAPPSEAIPPPVLPDPLEAIAREIIEWDWRLQDGIGAEREPRGWREAIEATLQRGDALIAHLSQSGALGGDGWPARDAILSEWKACRREWESLPADPPADDPRGEDLWRRAHEARRRIALAQPLARTGPILFAKRVPGSFSHQLTQYYGRCSRPGGGLFVLEEPGESMRCRRLAEDALPLGSVQHPEVSFDGRRALFAFCPAPPAGASDWRTDQRCYHLHEIDLETGEVRRLTSGPFDDFSPRYLPDGRILLLSTRRGGFHRCGRGPCPVYTLAILEPGGGEPRVISFHETHEWDPALLNDGRIVYTRWDYVDRHAVHYQQLWTVHPDGSQPVVFFGNNTLNPVGIWEARPVPGSHLVMATAAAHHAMTAGSIILVDTARGVDGLDGIARLTPDALFPESEAPVQHWHAPVGVPVPPPVPPEQKRWPGHCYRSPFPLSEDLFLAAYSFEPLIGEPRANPAAMFGIYLVDRFGNKELLYRDFNISSLWPAPLRPRPRPPVLPSSATVSGPREGTFFLQDVAVSWPALPRGDADRIRRLRILQVLPKSTPHANEPRVGLANASPGKQVLGTVPVEADGSAFFRAPAGLPIAFQALDDLGRAVQSMRSVTYLQPGESASCVGCHEHRTSAPSPRGRPLALSRPPSEIEPGPEGSRPFSYPLLVQPVLDARCVSCHGASDPAGGVVLTGDPQGEFTASYNALAPLVPRSEWKGGDFLRANSEPISRPGFFGAKASRLMDALLDGHEGVRLSRDDIARLVTWMDATALFYGTFDPADQARQRSGELIAGPAVE